MLGEIGEDALRRAAVGCAAGLIALVTWGAATSLGSGSPLAHAQKRTEPPRCAPGHHKLMSADAQVEVYHTIEEVIGCAYGSRRSFTLGQVLDEPESYGGVEAIALNGPIAAYGLSEFQKYSGRARRLVVVRNLRTGEIMHTVPTGDLLAKTVPPGSEGVGPVIAIVVKRDGATAWIVKNVGKSRQAQASYYEVHTLDRSGATSLLAEGTGIGPGSLALAGSTVYWTDEGKPRSTELQ